MDRIIPKSNTVLIRRSLWIGGLVVALISGGVLFANIDFTTQRIDRTTLSIATVERGTMEVAVAANGQLVSSRIEHLAARVPGRVARADIKPGAVVEVGQVLVELTNPQLIASAEEAQSAWEGAIAELQAADAELQTAVMNQEVVLTQIRFNGEKAKAKTEADEALSGAGLISDIELKRSRLDSAQLKETAVIETSRLAKLRGNVHVQLAVKQARVAQLARALERARAQAADLKVRAEIGGIVQAMQVDVGQQLEPGTPIGRIAQQDGLYAELKVPAREATQVQPGQKVSIDTRNGVVPGVVSRVDPGVTEGTVIVDVDLEGALPAGARPQLEVEGKIYIARIPDTLFVAKPSYVKSDAAITVYKLDSAGRYAERVPVRAGKVSLHSLQVLGGLRAGDRIITSEIGEWRTQTRVLLK